MGGSRTPGPVIPPHKVSISADGDLASKLAQLAVEAESIKQKMSDGRLPSSSRYSFSGDSKSINDRQNNKKDVIVKSHKKGTKI